MQGFTHLHVHTEYSLLDGANRIKDLMLRVKELGMKKVAITDHGVMYGVVDFYKQALANGIKPILGCEVYTARNSRLDKRAGIDADQGHLVLLAENNTGYKNLMKLSSIGFTEGFYYKPRVDIEVLKAHSEGLIALSACLSGDVPKKLLGEGYEAAKSMALQFNDIFGQGNFYLELQRGEIEEQNIVNGQLIKLSKETGIPLVATVDAHYLKKEDAKAHEILLCIQTGTNMNDEKHMRFSTNEFYIKSQEEVYELFSDVPEAISNTEVIAERCNVTLEFGKHHLPEFDLPDGETDPYEYLKKLCDEGMKKRYGESPGEDKLDRLNYELSMIHQMGYVDYFLIVWDFIKYAKDNGIMVGPGRGSSAGTIVAYCLNITNVDPLKYDLIFERFLNPERVTMPDIDIDFCYERRQEVIDYVTRKYGTDRVAQIITFGTMAARAVIRDVGRALGISYGEVDQVAKMIPFQLGIDIDKALQINPEFRKIYEDNPAITELVNMAKLLEGMPRHASTHAAGVVISKLPITEYVPLQKNDESVTTQFTMGQIDELGLLKMDFLGLRTLTVIRDAVAFIKQNQGIDIDIENLATDDRAVYDMMSEGKTMAVFQFEGSGMTQFIKEFKPSCFEDIIAGGAIYRPGPMDTIPRYISNKNNPQNIKYHHPLLEPILKPTYGCMVYQEQVIQIVRDLAGYSMGRGDLVRRAMAKKKFDVMQKERVSFVEGCAERGISEDVANKIFDEILDFASYAFPKAHATAYAVTSYQTAWLKCHYPAEFMAANLNSFMGSTDKVVLYCRECASLGIEILPPDINESGVRFTVSGNKIRFGLAAVKNVGENAMKEIIKNREQGQFKNFRDFCERISSEVNKRCVEGLIKSGAFDSFGIYRSKLMSAYEKIIDGINDSKKKAFDGQLSLFGENGVSKDEDNTLQDVYPEIKEYSQKELLSMEKSVLGLYISGHPLKELESELNKLTTCTSADFKMAESEGEEGLAAVEGKIKDGMRVTVGGIIAYKKTKLTKNNNLVAFIMLEDLFGIIEVIVFPAILERYASLVNEENVVLIKGRVSMREDEEPKIICDEIAELKKQVAQKLYIKLDSRENDIDSLHSLFKYFSGSTPVCIYDEVKGEAINLEKSLWVNINPSLLGELNSRFGQENIKLK